MQITLSRNELKALLARVFRALYGYGYDYHHVAQAVLWLECCGHNGVAKLIEALPYLEQDGLLKPALSQHAPNHFVMDSNGHSLFCFMGVICDLTMALAAEHDTARLDIINTQDSPALLGILKQAAWRRNEQKGFAAMTLCGGKLIRIKAGARFPIVYQSGPHEGVSLFCARSEQALEEYGLKHGHVLMDDKAQEKAYAASLESGVNIARSDYDALTLVANRVLVEASEASRKGAGE